MYGIQDIFKEVDAKILFKEIIRVSRNIQNEIKDNDDLNKNLKA